MRLRVTTFLALLAGLVLSLPACRRRGEDEARPGAPVVSQPAPVENAIPTDQLAAVLAAHREGVGQMERFQYNAAAASFRKVHELAPGWIPGSINLAIALLNSGGVVQEDARKGNGDLAAATSQYDQALSLLAEVLQRDPNNPYAQYCRGIIFESLGQIAEAHDAFRRVTEIDPRDGHAWCKLGSTLLSKDDPNRLAGPDQAKELIAVYSKAFEANPYYPPTLYKLQQAYSWDRQPARQKEIQALFLRMDPEKDPAAPGDRGLTVYGQMGRYATIIDYGPPATTVAAVPKPPQFAEPARLTLTLPEGQRWSTAEDFREGPLAAVGRARARFGAAVAVLDLDGDAKLDLFLAGAVVGPDGVRDVLLRNRGNGSFEDVSDAWGLPKRRVSLGAAAGDHDADGRTDLFLTGVGDHRLLRNAGDHFEDLTERAGLADPEAIAPTARWLDLDQDGDLDLYVVRYAKVEDAATAFTETPPAGLANRAYRNDGKPAPIENTVPRGWAPVAAAPSEIDAKEGLSLAFTLWPEEGAAALGGGTAPHTGVAWLDLDDDRDLDLVLAAESSLSAARNDRLGRFHAEELKLEDGGRLNGLLAADFDGDSRADLVAVPERGRVRLWRRRPSDPGGESGPSGFSFLSTNAADWHAAQAADLDLDGRADLLGLPREGSQPAWARNDGSTLDLAALNLGAPATARLDGLALADLSGDPLPDLLLLRDGEAPMLAENRGNGHHWLALTLSGRWKLGPDGGPMRTNSEGLGTRVLVQDAGLSAGYNHTTPESGLTQSAAPAVIGLGDHTTVDLVRLTWPDGVIQCELNQPADQLLALSEVYRKTGSCPVLFTFDGQRFVCIGDFLGGGGLGYLVAPGVYSDPDRDEAVAIAADQLRAVDGVLRLSVTEPMDEVAYLDRLTLEVVDRPPGVEVAPEERFAPGGNRPSGRLVAWRDEIEPERAADLAGRDLTETLRRDDRRTADGFRRLDQWIGYTEEHGIALDFGDRLAHFGPDDRLMLGLSGWVEYPYSQTNYAAATAGVALQPPLLERRNDDGSWTVLESDPGYPAGLPRLTLLDLTGKLGGPRCVLRLRTNMECYWDRAFVVAASGNSALRTVELPVARATLGHRGYMREVSPDGRQPLLYDYAHVDPAPLAQLRGRLTRYGDVAEPLRQDDDRLVLVGPGDEVRLEFAAGGLPALPEGWTRSYVLRSVGYCKDADPFTAASDTVGPLPWKGMGPYPYGPGGHRPADPAYDDYLRRYQTRAVDE